MYKRIKGVIIMLNYSYKDCNAVIKKEPNKYIVCVDGIEVNTLSGKAYNELKKSDFLESYLKLNIELYLKNKKFEDLIKGIQW